MHCPLGYMYIKATIAISYLAVTTSKYMCTQCAFYRENYMMADSDGGYDYQFVEGPPQDFLTCKICLSASRDPYLSVCCGHVFCKSCVDNVKQNPDTDVVKACPVCRNKEFTTFVNKQVDRLVKSLQIFCTNKEKGCKWQGELNSIDNHLCSTNGCWFEDVRCTNGCGEILQRCQLNTHLHFNCPNRTTICIYCHAKIQHKFILDGKHMKECPKFPLPCPNKCNKFQNILRENLQKHLDHECKLQKVECSNKCGVVIPRHYLASHLKSQCSLRIVKCQYCQYQDVHKVIESIHKSSCPMLPICCINKCGAVILQKHLNQHLKACPLEKVCCTYHDLGCGDVIIRSNQKKHNEELVEKHLQLVLSELNSTKQELTTTNETLSNVIDILDILADELNSTKEELTKRQTNIEKYFDKSNRIFVGVNVKTCPLYININEFTQYKNGEMLYSDSFYLYRGCKVRLWINFTYNQGPFLQLCLIKGPHNKETLKGELEVLLLSVNRNESLSIMSDKKCAITTGKKIISEIQLPVNAQVTEFLRGNGAIMWISFKPRSASSELFIG